MNVLYALKDVVNKVEYMSGGTAYVKMSSTTLRMLENKLRIPTSEWFLIPILDGLEIYIDDDIDTSKIMVLWSD